MSYNGWSNYETWLCHLWLTNYEAWYKMTMYEIKELMKEIQDEEEIIRKISAIIENAVEEMNPLEGEASMFSDAINRFIGRIDFYEISTSLYEDAKE